jgi:hypothetical protein
MTRLMIGVTLLVIGLVVMAAGESPQHFIENDFWTHARSDGPIPDVKLYGHDYTPYSCGHFVSANLDHAGLKLPRKGQLVRGLKGGCWYNPDGLPWIDDMFTMAPKLGIACLRYGPGPDCDKQKPGNSGQFKIDLGGAPHFFIWKEVDGGDYKLHAGKILPNGKYWAHNDTRMGKDGGDFYTAMKDHNVLWAEVFRVPPTIVNGATPQDFYSCDSTVPAAGGSHAGYFSLRHQWVCCWKE